MKRLTGWIVLEDAKDGGRKAYTGFPDYSHAEAAGERITRTRGSRIHVVRAEALLGSRKLTSNPVRARKGPYRKGKVPPHLRPFLFKKKSRRR